MMLQIKLGKGALCMNKEDILSAARKENKNHDLAEEHFNAEAGFSGYAVGALICFLLMFMSQVITGEPELACAIVYLGMMATRLIVKYRRKKDRAGITLGILLGVIALAGMVVYICGLAGVA